MRALQALVTEPATAGGIFNVGSTERIRIIDLATRVIEKTGSSSDIVFLPYEEVFERGIEEEMFHRSPSIAKIADAVDWEPSFDLDGILEDVVAAARIPSLVDE